jgi:hypothetical protein
MRLFMGGVRRQYDKAIDNLYLDDDFTPRYDSWDLVYQYERIFTGEGLRDEVLHSIHDDEWVAVDFAVPDYDVLLLDAWEAFCKAVKFKTRYVLWLRREDQHTKFGGELPVAGIMDAVAEVVDRIGLIRTLPTGSVWWRAQPHDADPIDHTAARLGTVPADLARHPNRMSPPGIAMFYGASDQETAIGEVTTPVQGPLFRSRGQLSRPPGTAASSTSPDCHRSRLHSTQSVATASTRSDSSTSSSTN